MRSVVFRLMSSRFDIEGGDFNTRRSTMASFVSADLSFFHDGPIFYPVMDFTWLW